MPSESEPPQTQAAPHPPLYERIGLSIIAKDAADAVKRIVEAEQAGLRQVWFSPGGSGGTDTLTVAAMAAARTTQIRLGTAIVPIYPRHPIVMAQQALAIHDIAPGRLRLGIGPSHRPIIEGSYGLQLSSPLTYLREYVAVLRGILDEGNIDYHGTFFNVTTNHFAHRTDPHPGFSARPESLSPRRRNLRWRSFLGVPRSVSAQGGCALLTSRCPGSASPGSSARGARNGGALHR
jgi:alkanesulfonate monooxygenase SsuD/methylene tetrahydromethanopterin reductase-like flavin-dependent oxidoreductase (luciferase family)